MNNFILSIELLSKLKFFSTILFIWILVNIFEDEKSDSKRSYLFVIFGRKGYNNFSEPMIC